MNPLFTKALQLAAKIEHPVTAAVFAAVLALIGLWIAVKSKRPAIGWVFAGFVGILGLAPIVADTYIQSRGVYGVQVQVFDEDGNLATDADVRSRLGGEKKQTDHGLEFAIPVPGHTGKQAWFDASVANRSLVGNGVVTLAKDLEPYARVQLKSRPSVDVRGEVRDRRGFPVVGAEVSIVDYPDSVESKANGSFVIPSHVPAGQQITVRARLGYRMAALSQASTTPFNLQFEK